MEPHVRPRSFSNPASLHSRTTNHVQHSHNLLSPSSHLITTIDESVAVTSSPDVSPHHHHGGAPFSEQISVGSARKSRLKLRDSSDKPVIPPPSSLPFFPPVHSLLQKMSRRNLCVLLYIVMFLAVYMLLSLAGIRMTWLYLRTGSAFLHEGKWYSPRVAAWRHLDELKTFHDSYCALKQEHRNKRNTIQKEALTDRQSNSAASDTAIVASSSSPSSSDELLNSIDLLYPMRANFTWPLTVAECYADIPEMYYRPMVPFSCLLPDPCKDSPRTVKPLDTSVFIHKVQATADFSTSFKAALSQPSIVYIVSTQQIELIHFLTHTILRHAQLAVLPSSSHRRQFPPPPCHVDFYGLPKIFWPYPSYCIPEYQLLFVRLPVPLSFDHLPLIHHMLLIDMDFGREMLPPLYDAIRIGRKIREMRSKSNNADAYDLVHLQRQLLSRPYIWRDLIDVDLVRSGEKDMASPPYLVFDALKVSLLSLSEENCQNRHQFQFPLLYIDPSPIRLIYMTYDDCNLIDGETGFLWPLGPAYHEGWTGELTPIEQLPLASDRKFTLNLMVTVHPEKPTRMQALIATNKWCTELASYAAFARSPNHSIVIRCLIKQSNFLHKVVEFVDGMLGTDVRHSEWLESVAPSQEYEQTLRDSIFTLCPAGKNPDQYRVWEAIMAGSIPIIELPDYQMESNIDRAFAQRAAGASHAQTMFTAESNSMCSTDSSSFPFVPPDPLPTHPSYGVAFNCRGASFHSFLRYTRAPVLFVRDWEKDLPRVLNRLTMEEIVTMQRELNAWMYKFVNNTFLHFVQHVKKVAVEK